MLKILNQYIDAELEIIEYTKDGKTVSHRVETPIINESTMPIAKQPTIEEMVAQTQLNTEYLVCLAELNNM